MQYVRGAITTQNLVPTGIATAGSAIQLPLLTDDGEVAIQVSDTYTGALTPQGSVDQVTWVDLAGVTNASTGGSSAAIASGAAGIFRADVSGLAHFRLSANGPVTGGARTFSSGYSADGSEPATHYAASVPLTDQTAALLDNPDASGMFAGLQQLAAARGRTLAVTLAETQSCRDAMIVSTLPLYDALDGLKLADGGQLG